MLIIIVILKMVSINAKYSQCMQQKLNKKIYVIMRRSLHYSSKFTILQVRITHYLCRGQKLMKVKQ